jgi:hypothetical protein
MRSPLTNAKRFVLALKNYYRSMWVKYCSEGKGGYNFLERITEVIYNKLFCNRETFIRFIGLKRFFAIAAFYKHK